MSAPAETPVTAVVDDRSEADRAAFAAASYVRRVVEPELVEVPPLPVEPAARRRVIAVRGW